MIFRAEIFLLGVFGLVREHAPFNFRLGLVREKFEGRENLWERGNFLV